LPLMATPALLQAIRQQAASGQWPAAKVLVDAYCQQYPRDAEGHFLRGQIYAKTGELPTALSALTTAESLRPGHPLAPLGQVAVLRDLGEFNAAHAALDRALKAAPALPDRDSQRASIWQSEGRFDLARQALADEIVRLGRAASARLFNNYAQCVRHLGEHEEAKAAFGRAIEVDAGYALAYRNLGDLLFYEGQMQAAEAVYRTMTERVPVDDAEVWRRWGHALNALGDTDAAERAWRQALALGDTEPMTGHSLLFQLKRRNACEEAVAVARHMAQRDPSDAAAQVAAALTLPTIYTSTAAMQEWRRRFSDGLAALAALDINTLAPQTVANLAWSNFHLAYQGDDDTALQTAWSALLTRWLDHTAPEYRRPLLPRERTGRLRIGFWSSFLRDCTVGKYFASWITRLPRDRCEVTIFHASFVEDDLVARLREAVDRHIRVVGGPMIHAEQIRAQALDILVYPEVGMDAATSVLACLRLAPVQVAGWGHPVTTGSTAIDYFVSVAAMEPADCHHHYQERLVCLPGLGTRYAMPMLSAAASQWQRADLGLPPDKVLLLVPQSAFKIHPDNDAMVATLLAQHPNAHVVLFVDAAPANSDALDARLSAHMQAHGIDWLQRRTWLARGAHDRFLAVNRLCDLMLDTLHWSGGNTSLDAIAMGLPIVTLPGRFMRGRQSMAMLRMLEITQTIASDLADYVDIAGRLITDPDWRAQQRTMLTARAPGLFDDDAASRAWVEWILNAADGPASRA
jgi:protein O-GlcNAc transferase